MDSSDTDGMTEQEQSQNETHPMGKHGSLTLLMRLSYDCRQKPSITGALRGSTQQLTETDEDTHSQALNGCKAPLKNSWGRIESPEGMRTT